MNGKILLPVHGDWDHLCDVMHRIEGRIISAIRGDYAKIEASYTGKHPVYTIEITTNDFSGLMDDLEEDGFI